ncbi:hypothetical protein [Streptomyces sp. ISL-100]|uniref:hypothetical protein n=1 Tax=Streptomyces sp. ISL-100 TaxID=2819173 RepID=UPI001BE57670|nr:hypothetical protein [Streptomyces sp. ISL-100]MBT2400404.1 hypothetical protein [Streptomyces sp. ISL-100]
MRIRKLLAVTAVAAAAVLGSIGPATAEDEEMSGTIIQTASGHDQPYQKAKSPNTGVNRVGDISDQSENPVAENPDQGAVGELLGRLMG